MPPGISRERSTVRWTVCHWLYQALPVLFGIIALLGSQRRTQAKPVAAWIQALRLHPIVYFLCGLSGC